MRIGVLKYWSFDINVIEGRAGPRYMETGSKQKIKVNLQNN